MLRSVVLPIVAFLAAGTAGRSIGAQEASSAFSADRAPRFLLASSPAPVPIDVSNTPALRRRIAVDLRDVTLEEALATISREAGFNLMYSKAVVPLDRVVRLRAEDITVVAALTEVLLGAEVDVVFSATGHAVLVRRAPPPRRASRRQVGTITGLVTDAETSQPVYNAQVVVVGTQQGAFTGDDGRYTVANVTAGARQVRVLRLGYNAVTQPVTVTDGQAVTLDFRLTQSTVTFDEVVVTATGETQRKRESGATVGTIDVDSLQLSPINTFSDLLSSRVAGVTVQS
ncbi:MAG: carboxypeptidase-like regulatory domain-containing protein, partial [Gemmatimonadaceae bacterium]